jgi:hypothetical protein
MLTGLRMPRSLLENEDTQEENEDSSEDEQLDEEEEVEQNVHVEVSSGSVSNITGSAEEIATRFTAKELKDLCKNKGFPTNGDKKTLANRLIEEKITIEN